MAKGRIEKGDIVAEGVLNDFNKDIETTIANINTLKLAVVAVAETGKKLKQGVSTVKPKDVKTVEQFNALTKKSNQNAENRYKIDNDLLVLKEQLKQQQTAQNKAIKTEVALGDKQLNTLEKIRARNAQLKTAKDKVNITTKKGQAQLKRMNDELNRNNKILDQNASKLGKLKNNIGNYGSALGKLKGLGSALGITAGIAGLVSVFKGAFNTVKEFEQSMANLSAITGATGKDLEFLRDKAIELGKVTTLSAGQVAEGFKIIASAKPELLQDAEALAEVTKQAITLAEAAGIELPEAALAVTTALNSFGAGADEAAKFVDVLAAGSKFGAGDINFLNEAMVKVGTVASSAGLGIQETVGALELLAEKGIPASAAGNQLKGVLLNLQKEGKGFIDGKFNLQGAIAQVNEELNEIKDPAKKAAAEIKLFGTQNIVTGQTLLKNNGRLAEMTEAVDANGIALEQQRINNDTLGGAVKSLASQYEAWILKSSQAGGAVDKLKDGIKFLADNFETIIGYIGLAAKAFLAYKAVAIITTIQTNIMTMSFVRLGLAQGGIKGALAAMSGGLKNVGKALASNAIGIAIVAIVLAFSELKKQMDRSKQASIKYKEIQEEINQIHESATEKIGEETGSLEVLVAQIKVTNTGSEERGRLLEELNTKYGTNLQNIQDETKFLKLLDIEQQKIIDNMVVEIRLQAKKDEFTQIIKNLQIEEEKLSKMRENAVAKYGKLSDKEIKAKFKDLAMRMRIDHAIQRSMDTVDKKREWLVSRNAGYDAGEQKSLVEKLKRDRKALESTLLVQLKSRAEDKEKNKPKKTPEQITCEKAGGTWDKATMTCIPKKKPKGDDPKVEKEISLQKEIEDAQIELVKKEQEREELALAKKHERLIKATEAQKTNDLEFIEWKKLQEEIFLQDLNKIQEKYDKDKEEKVEKVEKVSQEQINVQQAEYNILIADANISEKKMNELLTEQILAKAELEKLGKTELERKIIDRKALNDINALTKKEIDNTAELVKIREESLQFSQDVAIALIDKRIEALDRETAAHIKQAETFRTLAENGSIEAKESLAEENRLAAESERKAAELEKRKQRILMVTNVLKAFNANLSVEGTTSGEALAKAITSEAVLNQFIASIGSAYEGMEDTGKATNPLDSNGGRVMLLHDNERIMTAKQNAMIGGVSNDHVAQVMEQHRLGNYMDGGQLVAKVDNAELVNGLNTLTGKIEAVEKAILNQPKESNNTAEMLSNYMVFENHKIQGGKTTTSRFKVKR